MIIPEMHGWPVRVYTVACECGRTHTKSVDISQDGHQKTQVTCPGCGDTATLRHIPRETRHILPFPIQCQHWPDDGEHCAEVAAKWIIDPNGNAVGAYCPEHADVTELNALGDGEWGTLSIEVKKT